MLCNRLVGEEHELLYQLVRASSLSIYYSYQYSKEPYYPSTPYPSCRRFNLNNASI